MKDAVGYAVAVVCWMLTVPCSILVPLQIRNALNVVWPALGSGNQWRWLLRPVDRFSLLIMGLGWLAFVPWSLLFYIRGVVKDRRGQAQEPAQGRRWKRALREYDLYLLLWRFLLVMGTLILLFVLSYLAQQLGLLAIERMFG